MENNRFNELTPQEVMSGIAKEGNFWKVLTKKIHESASTERNQTDVMEFLKLAAKKTKPGKAIVNSINFLEDTKQSAINKKEDIKTNILGSSVKVLEKLGLMDKKDSNELLDNIQDEKDKLNDIEKKINFSPSRTTNIIDEIKNIKENTENTQNTIKEYTKDEDKDDTVSLKELKFIKTKVLSIHDLIYDFTHKQDTSITKHNKPNSLGLLGAMPKKGKNGKDVKDDIDDNSDDSSFIGDLITTAIGSKLADKLVPKSAKNFIKRTKIKALRGTTKVIEKLPVPKVAKKLLKNKLNLGNIKAKTPKVSSFTKATDAVKSIKTPKVSSFTKATDAVKSVKTPKVSSFTKAVKAPKIGALTKGTKIASKVLKPLSKIKGGGVLKAVSKKLPLIGSAITVGLSALEYSNANNDTGRKKAVLGGAGGAAGAYAGAAIGQILIPIPFLGAAIGGVLGGLAGDYLGRKSVSLISDVDDNIDDKNKENPFTFKAALLAEKAKYIKAEPQLNPKQLKEAKIQEKKIDARILEVTSKDKLQDYLADTISDLQDNKKLSKEDAAKLVISKAPEEYQAELVEIYNKKIVGGWFHKDGDLSIKDVQVPKKTSPKISPKADIKSNSQNVIPLSSTEKGVSSVLKNVSINKRTPTKVNINGKDYEAKNDQFAKAYTEYNNTLINLKTKEHVTDKELIQLNKQAKTVLSLVPANTVSKIPGVRKLKKLKITKKDKSPKKMSPLAIDIARMHYWMNKDKEDQAERILYKSNNVKDYLEDNAEYQAKLLTPEDLFLIAENDADLNHDVQIMTPNTFSNEQIKSAPGNAMNTLNVNQNNTSFRNTTAAPRTSAPKNPSISTPSRDNVVSINNNTKELAHSKETYTVKIIEKQTEPVIVNNNVQSNAKHENTTSLASFKTKDTLLADEMVGGY